MWEQQFGKTLTALNRFRVRKRNPPPQSICQGGRRTRSLDETVRSVLTSWLQENWEHPYPSVRDRQRLSERTGLTNTQIRTWFANARRRKNFKHLHFTQPTPTPSPSSPSADAKPTGLQGLMVMYNNLVQTHAAASTVRAAASTTGCTAQTAAATPQFPSSPESLHSPNAQTGGMVKGPPREPFSPPHSNPVTLTATRTSTSKPSTPSKRALSRHNVTSQSSKKGKAAKTTPAQRQTGCRQMTLLRGGDVSQSTPRSDVTQMMTYPMLRNNNVCLCSGQQHSFATPLSFPYTQTVNLLPPPSCNLPSCPASRGQVFRRVPNAPAGYYHTWNASRYASSNASSLPAADWNASNFPCAYARNASIQMPAASSVPVRFAPEATASSARNAYQTGNACQMPSARNARHVPYGFTTDIARNASRMPRGGGGGGGAQQSYLCQSGRRDGYFRGASPTLPSFTTCFTAGQSPASTGGQRLIEMTLVDPSSCSSSAELSTPTTPNLCHQPSMSATRSAVSISVERAGVEMEGGVGVGALIRDQCLSMYNSSSWFAALNSPPLPSPSSFLDFSNDKFEHRGESHESEAKYVEGVGASPGRLYDEFLLNQPLETFLILQPTVSDKRSSAGSAEELPSIATCPRDFLMEPTDFLMEETTESVEEVAAQILLDMATTK